MELESFLESIKVEFCLLLYRQKIPASWDHDEKISTQFPFCCDLASQLIASYLFAHYSSDTKCLHAYRNCKPHYWCECNGVIVDLTDFQFSGSTIPEQIRKGELSDSEFEKYVNRGPDLCSGTLLWKRTSQLQ